MRHVCEHGLDTPNVFVDVEALNPHGEWIPFFPAMTLHETVNKTVILLPDGDFRIRIIDYTSTPIRYWAKNVFRGIQ